MIQIKNVERKITFSNVKVLGKKCIYSQSPRRGSFFGGVSCKISVTKVLDLIYFWSIKMTVKQTAKELKVKPDTVTNYFIYLRETCIGKLIDRGENIIGGEGLTVKIYESKFFKNKYGKGRPQIDQKNGWVFGGICRETKEFFKVRVPDRTADTLIPIIHKHTRPGTTIVSDEWRVYNSLGKSFIHKRICHKYRVFMEVC